jgi:serine/threonine-protein kinase RIM15
LFEFLHGWPPFHAETPQLVFENILMRKIEWDEDLEISPQARQLMDGFMCTDVEKRLGTRGAAEVKVMEWFAGTDWDNLHYQKVFFVPTVKNMEDTDYFDTRGAQKPAKLSDSDEEKNENVSKEKLTSANEEAADFGEAVYKNLPLLEKANLKIMNKINQEFPEGEQWLQKRRDSLPVHSAGSPTPSFGSPNLSQPPRSISPMHFSSIVSARRDSMPVNPHLSLVAPIPISSKKKLPQPSNSFENLSRTSSSSLEPKNSPSLLLELPKTHHGQSHSARQSYINCDSDGSLARSNSPDQAFKKRSQAYLDSAKQTLFETRGKDDFSDDAANSRSDMPTLDVLIAESNPVAAQILETILRSLNCRCVRVKTGGDVVQCALGEIKFDIIFVDINLPVCNF